MYESVSRPLLLLGGVADALTEAITMLGEDSSSSSSLEATRATEACQTALDSLKKELTDDIISQNDNMYTFTELD